MLEIDPPQSRYGRVFVGGPQQARGRDVPRRLRRRPRRAHVPAAAARGSDAARRRDARAARRRAARCRRIARAASACCCASRSARRPSGCGCRIRGSTSPSRGRACRASTRSTSCARSPASIPQPQQLQERAAAEGRRRAGLAGAGAAGRRDRRSRARPVGPAGSCSQVEPPASVRGHAHYLLRLNEPLKRSVTARWARGRSQWTPYDGITRVTGMTQPMLESQRLGARPYSLSALQKYASCPYQFLLSAIYRLEPPRDIEPLQKLDPLTRGSIFHEAQARFFRALKADGRLPLARAGHRRTRWPRSTRVIADGRRGATRTISRRRSIASGATRSPTSPRPPRLGRGGCRCSRRLGARRTSSSRSACRTTTATRSRQRARSRARRRPLQAARLGRSDRATKRRRRSFASPITRPARTGRRGRR